MRDLFYSPHEGILFWVSGYNSDRLSQVIKDSNRFKKLAKCQTKDISLREVTNSSRYKNMLVYWTKTDFVPEETFRLSIDKETCERFNLKDDWTMWKWLNN
jgi:hypothetical protein